MAYLPIQLFSTPQEDYAGWWVKFYEQGTVTPLSMATDAAAGTLLAKAEISSGGTVPIGFIKTAGDALLNPFLNADYDCWLFPTSAEADANDTTNAIQVADDLNTDQGTGIKADFASTDSGKGTALIGWLSNLTSAVGRTLYDWMLDRPVSVFDFMTAAQIADVRTATGAVDVTAAIQSAIDSGAPVVQFPAGLYRLESPVKWKQACKMIGAGTLSGASGGGTEFICEFTSLTPPGDVYQGNHAIVLDKAPMLYNTELITQSNLSGIRLNANNKDVYGLYVNEIFYSYVDIFVTNCPNSPITLIYAQFNSFGFLVAVSCSAPVRLIACTTLNIRGIDIEANDSAGTVLDVIADTSTKGSVVINNFHYEEGGAGSRPTGANIMQLSGRNVHIKNGNWSTSGTASVRYVDFTDTSNYTFDGVTVAKIAAVGCSVDQVNISSPTIACQLSSGAAGNLINTNISTTLHVDNSGRTDNRIQTNISGGNRFSRDMQVVNSSQAAHLWFEDDSKINFFNSSNRFIEAVGADLNLENLAGRVIIKGSSDVFVRAVSGIFDIDCGAVNAGQFDDSSTAGDTRFLIYDVDNGTLERVTVGAADSGGTGYKVLRILN